MYAAIQDGRFLICDESEVACEAFARGCASVDEYRDWLEALPTDRWGRPRIPEAPYRMIELDGALRERYDELRGDGYETREILYRDVDDVSEVGEAGAPDDPGEAANIATDFTDGTDDAGPLAPIETNVLIGDDEARAARTEPDAWREIRAQRDQLLLESDKYMIPDFPIEAAEREAWRKYRAALRDITKAARRPDRVRWPVRP